MCYKLRRCRIAFRICITQWHGSQGRPLSDHRRRASKNTRKRAPQLLWFFRGDAVEKRSGKANEKLRKTARNVISTQSHQYSLRTWADRVAEVCLPLRMPRRATIAPKSEFTQSKKRNDVQLTVPRFPERRPSYITHIYCFFSTSLSVRPGGTSPVGAGRSL